MDCAIIYDSVSQEIEEQLDGYKITPKGMLQIYLGQRIPIDRIRQICMDTLDK